MQRNLTILRGAVELMIMANEVFTQNNFQTVTELKQISPSNEIKPIHQLAHIIMAEAEGESFTGKRLVADAVLNRVDSDLFPDSIESVIFQPYQFSCIKDGRYDKVADRITEECYKAARLEYYADERLDGGVLYFNSGSSSKNGVNPYREGNHWFSY